MAPGRKISYVWVRFGLRSLAIRSCAASCFHPVASWSASWVELGPGVELGDFVQASGYELALERERGLSVGGLSEPKLELGANRPWVGTVPS